MSTLKQESKTERLILNFTVQERHTLKELYLRSHSVSESDFVRRAVELYADLHRRVVAGAQIVLRNDAKRQQTGVVITKRWSRDTMAPPDRQSPRQNFELKIEGSAKEIITRMVQAGATPSAARLVWAAICTYSLILDNTEEGFVLMEKKGQEFNPIQIPL